MYIERFTESDLGPVAAADAADAAVAAAAAAGGAAAVVERELEGSLLHRTSVPLASQVEPY